MKLALSIQQLVVWVLVLIAFAANSILCRLALHPEQTYLIDPASFTLIRLLAGAIVLSLIIIISSKQFYSPGILQLRGAVYLFVYAGTFSFAYISLSTGTGALILFGSVQLSIVGLSLWLGKRLAWLEWLGIVLAIIGLLILTLPGWQEGEGGDVVLMITAGLAWGLFTLNGMNSRDPLTDMSWCFLFSVPLSVLLIGIGVLFSDLQITRLGVVYAALSGAVASGLGYALWYWLLPDLTTAQAGTSQLLVPVIAAIGGVILLAEPFTINFLIATTLTLSGIALVIYVHRS